MKSIAIYIDFKSPASYLAIRPVRHLLQETGAEATWKPFYTRLTSIPTETVAETKGEKHRRVRAIARRDVHLLYADGQNLPMRFRDQPFESRFALALFADLDRNIDTFIDTAFRYYWQDQLDLNDPDVLTRLLKEISLDRPLPDLQAIEGILNRTSVEALDQGVIDAPAFVIADQVFIGREHIPWMRQLLAEARPA